MCIVMSYLVSESYRKLCWPFCVRFIILMVDELSKANIGGRHILKFIKQTSCQSLNVLGTVVWHLHGLIKDIDHIHCIY